MWAGAHGSADVVKSAPTLATVATDVGFINPDEFCDRYCHWSASEHEIGARLWQAGGECSYGCR
eukprot:COSAG01_NODE_564_length_15447_cov_14.174811_14_plen_64_part_00